MSGSLIEALAERLPQGVKRVRPPETVPHCDLVVQTPVGFAFFRLIRPHENVVEKWREVQGEIARFLEDLSRQGERGRAFLTLLLEANSAGNEEMQRTLQRIANNRFVCRKLIYDAVTERDPDDILRSLPFLPLQVDRKLRDLPPSPLDLAKETTLGVPFAERLMGTQGMDAIAEALVKGELEPISERAETQSGPFSPAQAGNGTDRLVITAVTLRHFRNYGGETTIELCPGLNVIYGRNGTGKSSICEAIEWALTGRSSRLQQEYGSQEMGDRPLLHLFSTEGQVRLRLRGTHGRTEWELARKITLQGTQPPSLNGRPWDNRRLLLWLSTLPADTRARVETLQFAFRYAHFLGQDNMQQFLSEQPTRRQEAFSFLVGTEMLGRVIRRAAGVAESVERRLRQIERELADVRSSLAEAERRQQEYETRLRQRTGGAVVSAEELAPRAHSLVQTARACGIDTGLSQGREASIAWRAMAQTVLQVVPFRRQELESRDTRILQLMAEIHSVVAAQSEQERWLQERDTLQTKIKRLEQEWLKAREGQRKAAEDAALVESEMNAIQQKKEQADRYLTLLALRHQLGEKLQKLTSQLAEVEDRLKELAATISAQQAEQRKQQKEAEATKQEAAHCAERLGQLQRVKAQLADWQTTEVRLRGGEVAPSDLQERLAAAERDLASYRAHLAETARLVQGRQELLARLKQYLLPQESVCPFCGHDWQDASALHQAVQSALEHLPAALVTIQAQVAESEERVRQLRTLVEADRQVRQLLPGKDLVSVTEADVLEAIRDAETATATLRERELAARRRWAELQAAIAELQASVQQERERERSLAAERAYLQAQYETVNQDLDNLAPLFPSDEAAKEIRKEMAEAEQRLQARLAEARKEEARYVTKLSEISRDDRLLRDRLNDVDSQVERLRTHIQLFLTAVEQTVGERVSLSHAADRLAAAQLDVQKALKKLEDLGRDTQRFLALVEALELYRQIQELDQLRRTQERRVEELENEKRRLESIRDAVREFETRMAEAKEEEEKRRLEHFEPLTQAIYDRLCGHPYLGKLQIVPTANDLQIRIYTARTSRETVPVTGYLSTAQEHAVALSLFLSSALVQGWTRLGTICLDDPVQHMDELNVFAFLDLLRALVDNERQIVLTTASEDLYRLILSRFGRMGEKRFLFRAIRLVGVTPQGPEVIYDTPLETAVGQSA